MNKSWPDNLGGYSEQRQLCKQTQDVGVMEDVYIYNDHIIPRVNLTVRSSGVWGTKWGVKTRSWRVCISFEG